MSNDFSSDFDFFREPDEAAPDSNFNNVFPDPVAFDLGIVGIGQCGNNMADIFYNDRIGYRKIIAINTAAKDLESLKNPVEKICLGTADKQGAGKDPEVGRRAVEKWTSRIRAAFGRMFGDGKIQKLVVCMGLGGGTGSGGGPEILSIASDMLKEWGMDPKKDLIVIATLPEPLIDGPRQCFNALKAYGKIEKFDCPRLYVDNAKIRKFIRATFDDPWEALNYWVAKTLHQFNVYAAKRSNHAVFDGQDMADVLSRGRFIFSAFPVRKFDNKFSVGDVMSTHLANTLFADTNLSSSDAAACVVILNRETVGNRNPEDLSPVFMELNNMMKKHSTLHRGVYMEDMPEKPGMTYPDVFCYVMLGGLDHPMGTLNPIFEKAKDFSPEYGTFSAFLDS